MPELPEVEVVRRALSNNIVGKIILDIDIRYNNIIDGDVSSFKNNIINKKITSIDRLGKFLIINLDDGNIVSHLRMEGKYFYVPSGSLDNKHIHVVFKLDNGYDLMYQDVRKFGRMEYKNNNELYSSVPLLNVGADFTKNDDYNLEDLYNKIIKKNIPIKTVLLDQSIIAGLGNIYVDEVLFKSHINPHRLASIISYQEFLDIIKYSKEIMDKAILCGGSTIRSYTSQLGVSGTYQNYLCVHTKDICPVCGTKITKDKTNGRGTYYCIKCQK